MQKVLEGISSVLRQLTQPVQGYYYYNSDFLNWTDKCDPYDDRVLAEDVI